MPADWLHQQLITSDCYDGIVLPIVNSTVRPACADLGQAATSASPTNYWRDELDVEEADEGLNDGDNMKRGVR